MDGDRQGERQITELLRSSDKSWVSTSTDVMPRFDEHGLSGWQPSGAQESRLLGVISAGRFDSFFAGKPSPLLAAAEEKEAQQAATDGEQPDDKADAQPGRPSSVIERSPESARIILFASNDFLQDQMIQLAGSAAGSEYLNSLQLLANAVDWSLEDAGLLGIRARGHFNRTLPPMEHGTQLFWEYLNYALAAAALVGIALLQRRRKRARQVAYMQLLPTSS